MTNFVILMMGYTATGKSTLAKRLSKSLGTDIFHSAVTRKELNLMPSKEEAVADFFVMTGDRRKEVDKKVYSENTNRTINSLEKNRSVIIDSGNFFTWQRNTIYTAVVKFRPEIIIVRTLCGEKEVMNRLSHRMKNFGKTPFDETPSIKAYESCKIATESPDNSDSLPWGKKPTIIDYDTEKGIVKVVQGDESSVMVKKIIDAIKIKGRIDIK
jgi:predicted kinase